MSALIERLGMAALRRMDPEKAHALAIVALKSRLAPLPPTKVYPRLQTRFAGLEVQNPVGLAAGFDKNAEGLHALVAAGFGFVEVGAVTPRAQPGNPKPRLFRLPEDRAIINRFGFNNDGMDAVAPRLEARPKAGVIGLNLGANKDSDDKAADFAAVLARCAGPLDFATINVSSPNTERLRDLQGKDALRGVLARVQDTNQGLARPLPLLVKIAPDLSEADLDDIAAVAEEARLSGIVATNTTLRREGLASAHRDQAGGLSGKPLFALSTQVLAGLKARTDLPLIGVGGVASGADAMAKLKAGATLVQLYSALAYEGLGLLPRILADLDRLVADQS